jgi:hypothetical protein
MLAELRVWPWDGLSTKRRDEDLSGGASCHSASWQS